MTRRPSFAAVLTLALSLAACTAAAQSVVPEELVRALLAPSSPGHVPNISLGRLPRGFPAELVPGDARVIGGVWRDSTWLVAALAVPQQPAQAGDALQQALAGAGFMGPETGQVRGFIGPASTGTWRFVCRGTEQVSMSAAPAPGGGSYLRVDYMRGEHNASCANRTAAARNRAPWDEVPLPTLTMPSGVTMVTSGYSAGSVLAGADGAGAMARLRSSLGAGEIAARFADQLLQAGWRAAGEPSATPAAALQSFRRRTEDGKEWFGVLIAVAVPGTQLRDVRFEVHELAAETR